MRLSAKHRREVILKAGIEVARVPGGWSALTRERIALRAGCSDGLVSRALGSMTDVRRAIMREAVRSEILEIVIQSLAACDRYYIPKALKRKALIALLGD